MTSLPRLVVVVARSRFVFEIINDVKFPDSATFQSLLVAMPQRLPMDSTGKIGWNLNEL